MEAIKPAIASQYLATLAMLKECVSNCPDQVWHSGKHPRNTWRIAVHATFYAHQYMMPSVEVFTPFKQFQDQNGLLDLWEDANAPVIPAIPQSEVLEYISFIESIVVTTINGLDLSSPESGFPWYKNFPKLDHLILSLRHLATHVGQLEEILNQNNIDYSWISRVNQL